MRELTEHVLFGELLDQAGVVLIGNKVTAVLGYAFLQHIADLTEVRLERSEHCLPVLIGRSPRLLGLVLGLHGLSRQGLRSGLIELGLEVVSALHATDAVGDLGDLGLHALIGSVIRFGESAVLIGVRVEEGIHRRNELVALVAQFSNSHFVSSVK